MNWKKIEPGMLIYIRSGKRIWPWTLRKKKHFIEKHSIIALVHVVNVHSDNGTSRVNSFYCRTIGIRNSNSPDWICGNREVKDTRLVKKPSEFFKQTHYKVLK